ncbi:cytochrome b-c1 complex subunit 9 [Entophlyctis helioformis]|nr:cytochrome b-c1 complex subunit 9 [Entophlyctis helioformis]
MSLQRTIYNVFFKRSSSYVATIFATAFVYELAFDGLTDKLWDNVNKGRQWKDIRSKYIEN